GDEVARRLVLVAGVGEADERAAERPQILIAANRVLVLRLREAAPRLVVALGRGGVRRREPVVADRQLRELREARLRDGVVGERRSRRRVADDRREPPG